MATMTLTNVNKTIKQRMILKDISLRLESGRIYGFQGKNGSGKTMLFRAIAGLVRIDSGTIDIFGKTMGWEIQFPDSIGLVIENVGFWPGLTGAECLETLRGIKNTAPKSAVGEALDRVGLDPQDSRKYKAYSLGMKQKLAIAQAIMENPQLLVLDEPGNGLDESALERLTAILGEAKASGALVLLSSHDGDLLNGICDEIYCMADGVVSSRADKTM